MIRLLKITVIVLFAVAFIIIIQSCKRKPTIPLLTTLNVTGITQTSALSGGNVTTDGGAEVTAKGVCWGTSENPSLSGSKTSDGTGIGSFTSSLTSLTPGTKYYVRAYATNSEGTAYGNKISFSTNEILTATVQTTTVESITGTSAVSGGTIASDGGGAITGKGVCWATIVNPTISNDKTDDGNGTANFTSNITGLIPTTTYHVRAYAINSAGTAYGSDLTFTTAAVCATLTTATVTAITTTSAASGGNIITDGGSPVTTRGVCWSTSTNPTIADSHTTDGEGIGNFASSLTGLTANTTYYVRAYATNGVGTAYGNVLSLTTQQVKTVTDIDGNIYHYITIGNQIWMTENLKTTRYRNGDLIPSGLSDADWHGTTSGACAIYNDDNMNNDAFGKLYNWYAVTDTRHLCPTNWHEPSDAEWTILETYLTNNGYGFGGSGNDIAKSMSATSGWSESISAGSVGNDQTRNNRSGFSALPGGFRHYNGFFDYINYIGFWWSSSSGESGSNDAWSRYLQNDSANLNRIQYDKHKGLSVRCIKDQ